MLPLHALVHRCKAFTGGEDRSTKEYMYACCLELHIGSASQYLESDKYRAELTDNLASLVSKHITNAMLNYRNPNASYLAKPEDAGQQIENKPMLLRVPDKRYITLLDDALRGYKPLVLWEPKIIVPPADADCWFPFPVMLYFFEIGNFCFDHTKANPRGSKN